MSEYMMSAYVKPVYLDWTLQGIKIIFERYGANLHVMRIEKANRSNPSGKKAHSVTIMFDVEPQMIPYIERRLLKEPGVLK